MKTPENPGTSAKNTKKRTKREENREKSQDLILRASLELFSLKGYGSTTMEMIADRAGISRGLPYLYFESKDKILYTILERHFTREKVSIESLTRQYDSKEEFVDAIIAKLASPFHEGSESDPCLEMRLIMSMMLLPETKSLIQDWVFKFQSEIMEKYFKNMEETFAHYGIQNADKEIEYLRMLFFGFIFCKLCMGEEFPAGDMEKRIRSNYLDWVDCKASKRGDS